MGYISARAHSKFSLFTTVHRRLSLRARGCRRMRPHPLSAARAKPEGAPHLGGARAPLSPSRLFSLARTSGFTPDQAFNTVNPVCGSQTRCLSLLLAQPPSLTRPLSLSYSLSLSLTRSHFSFVVSHSLSLSYALSLSLSLIHSLSLP